MKKNSKKKIKTHGVTVRFELLDEDFNIVEVLCEKTFPDADFDCKSSWLNPNIKYYHCWDKEVNDYVEDQHGKFNLKYDYVDWENAPIVRQAYYNVDGELLYTVDEVDHEMNL